MSLDLLSRLMYRFYMRREKDSDLHNGSNDRVWGIYRKSDKQFFLLIWESDFEWNK